MDHAITFEPTIQLKSFSVKLSSYYALIYDEAESTAIDAQNMLLFMQNQA
jgi:hypothetical protein